MVLPSEILIKHEKVELENYSPEDTLPEDCSGQDYDFKVKVEVENNELCPESYWCFKPVCSEDTFEENGSVSYEELIDYCVQRCTVCNEKFWESYSLLRHNLEHLKLQINPLNHYEHRCMTCFQYFSNASALSEHIATHKPNLNEETFQATKIFHQCNICGVILNYKSWHSHMKEIHGSQIFRCSICDMEFKCKRYLRNHINTHQTKKKHKTIKCHLCPVILQTKNALKTHLRTCHSEIKYKCHICNSTLKCKTYLHAHLRRVHYDDGKQHKCDCGKSFKSPRYLKVHMKNAHGKKNKNNSVKKSLVKVES